MGRYVDARRDDVPSGGGAVGIQLELADGAIASGTFGRVERAVAALEQAHQRLARGELRDADRGGDAREDLAGRTAGDLTIGDPLADALGDVAGHVDIRAG